MRSITIILLSLLALSSCKRTEPDISTSENSKPDFTQYVNPLIGTSKMGHVFPGATAPFGMVQLSPQTNFVTMFLEDGRYNPKTYEYCAAT